MKQCKEMWELVFNWLGNGKKTVMGAGFLLAGFLWNMAGQPAHILEQVPFIIMVTGGLCLVNALFSRLLEQNINLLGFILIYICIMELGMALMGGDVPENADLVLIWSACFVFVWALNYALLETTGFDGVIRKIVFSFFEALAGAAVIVGVFAATVWLALI